MNRVTFRSDHAGAGDSIEAARLCIQILSMINMPATDAGAALLSRIIAGHDPATLLAKYPGTDAADLAKRGRQAIRDRLIYRLYCGHYRRTASPSSASLSFSAAAAKIANDARRYYAGAAFKLAQANGQILADEADTSAAVFFEIWALGVNVPSTGEQIRRILKKVGHVDLEMSQQNDDDGEQGGHHARKNDHY